MFVIFAFTSLKISVACVAGKEKKKLKMQTDKKFSSTGVEDYITKEALNWLEAFQK